jgi:hypothetical protein
MPTPDPTAADQVLRVFGRWGMAHACAVETAAGRFVVTSAHVVDQFPTVPGAGLYALQWSDGAGHEGLLRPINVDRARDLALMYVESGEISHWYPVASGPPLPGERLALLAYRWEGRDHVLEDRRVTARVLRVVAGHVVYVPLGVDYGDMAGASGGCSINSRKEAVSLHDASIQAGVGDFASVGVGIWGEQLTYMVVDARREPQH